MELTVLINNHKNIDYSYDRVDESFIPEMEKLTGVKMGEELKHYILNYGYLGCEHIELFGVTCRQGTGSDMIRRTLFLHDHFDITKSMIAVEDQGDGDYYLVDSDDMVFRFVAGDDKTTSTDLHFYEYILSRLQSC